MSRGLAECDFPPYVGGNFKNLIPTRLSLASRSPAPSLIFPPSRDERERERESGRRRAETLLHALSGTILALRDVISFATRSRCALCSLGARDERESSFYLATTPAETVKFGVLVGRIAPTISQSGSHRGIPNGARGSNLTLIGIGPCPPESSFRPGGSRSRRRRACRDLGRVVTRRKKRLRISKGDAYRARRRSPLLSSRWENDCVATKNHH